MNPRVSIIIPCHNAAPWLAATLESALAQTCTDREILVVDDGSTDSSRAIAAPFRDRGVTLATQANAGASAARNHGLRLARGEFIQFLDADDLLSPDKIESQLRTHRRAPAGAVVSCRWGRFTDDPAAARFVDDAVYRDFAPVDFLVLAANTRVMMHPSAWLVPRAVADRAGPWDESLSLDDDGEYFARVLLASDGVVFCPDPGARSLYRSGLPGSLSRRRDDRARRSQFRAYDSIARQLRAAEDSPRTRQAEANLFQRYVQDFFPAPADLIAAAEARSATLGGGTLGAPPMGPRNAAVARLIGWKNLRRILRWFGK